MSSILTFAGRDTTLQSGDTILVSEPHGCVQIELIRQGTFMKINGKSFAEIIGLRNRVSASDVCDVIAAACNLRCVLLLQSDPQYMKYQATHGVHIDLFALQS